MSLLVNLIIIRTRRLLRPLLFKIRLQTTEVYFLYYDFILIPGWSQGPEEVY